MPELTDYLMLRKQNKSEKLFFPTNNQFSLYNPYPIRIENLTFAYENRTILNQVNVQIPLNEKIALCGKWCWEEYLPSTN